MTGHPRRTPGRQGSAIASELRQLLEDKEISARQLAGLADISPSQLSRYLRAISSPTLDELLDICNSLNVHPSSVIGRALIKEKFSNPEARAEATLRLAQDFIREIQ